MKETLQNQREMKRKIGENIWKVRDYRKEGLARQWQVNLIVTTPWAEGCPL